jgi:flagellin
MLAIKNNLMAATAARQLGINYDSLAKSVERLSSGLRINSAKDDAAGLAVRELMRADIAVLTQGARNAQDGISLLQTMEGAMQTIDDALVRMKQLAQQAVTGTYSDAQRVIMNAEFAEMAEEIERIATATKFNDTTYLDNTDTVAIQVGDSDNIINVTGVDMTKSGLGIETGSAGYQAISDTGVASATADWVTVADSAATGYTTIDIQFAGEDAISIQLDTATGGTGQAYSLQDVADLINAETQNLGNDENGVSKNYSMASVALGDGTNGRLDNVYYLTLNSRLSDTAALTTLTSTASAATGSTTGGIVSGGTDADDLTEAIDEGTADQGLFGTQAGTGINILTTAAANSAMTAITAAITTKDTARAAFGYKMNRLEYTVAVINIQAENMLAAESRISDVDVATEMSAMTSYQVLAQAGVAMLSQANLMPQMALSLLR